VGDLKARNVEAMVRELMKRRGPWDCSYKLPRVGYWARGWDPRDRLYQAGWKPCFVVTGDEPCRVTAISAEGWTYA